MNAGTENRKKTILAGALGAGALVAIVYVYTQLFSSGTPTPPPTLAPVAATTAVHPGINAPIGSATGGSVGTNAGGAGVAGPAAPGVDAKRLATASASLDPTLDEAAMLRTESLVYSGTGRNIFSALYTPPVAMARLPKPIAPIRPVVPGPPPTPLPPPTCPPSCPPINLKFFGTEQHGTGGPRQAFLLQGDSVFLVSAGEIVARRYKVLEVTANSVRVEDLVNTSIQTLPLQSN